MTSRTNPHPQMQHPFPPRGARALPVVRAGGLVLLPTATQWQVVTCATIPTAVARLLTVCPPGTHNRPELLFADTTSLMKWCPRVHPRLFTLLAYHRRPLTVMVPAGARVPLPLVDERGEVAVRLAQDSFCYRLCEDLDAPLLATAAVGPGGAETPVSFGKVRCDVIRAVEHTVRRRQRDVLAAHPPLAARLGHNGELDFL